MALMSNILGNQSQNQFRDEPLGEQYAQLLFAQDSLYKIRGRGRPPRYSIDGEDEASGKCRPSFKVRPILPAGPGLTAGLAPVAANATPLQLAVNMPSAEPGVSQVKRLRLSGEPYPARGRKPKPVPPSREVNGKNKCPHCPQVYYSTQAMNDHINNVHSMNGQKYVCSICAKEFSWKISLNKHMRKLHNEDNNGGPVNCDTNNAGPHKPISTAIPMPV
ncbi:hypothetical protein HDE_07381 [Halotydeus destructor]|nr:hypothetical protein HDE_07381 [Halotydeus destructor]